MGESDGSAQRKTSFARFENRQPQQEQKKKQVENGRRRDGRPAHTHIRAQVSRGSDNRG